LGDERFLGVDLQLPEQLAFGAAGIIRWGDAQTGFHAGQDLILPGGAIEEVGFREHVTTGADEAGEAFAIDGGGEGKGFGSGSGGGREGKVEGDGGRGEAGQQGSEGGRDPVEMGHPRHAETRRTRRGRGRGRGRRGGN
jgi:hypothetical protein